MRREFAFNGGEFGLPRVVFVQIVSVQRDAQLAQDRGIKRVVGTGRENVLARIDQRRKADVHRLAHSGGNEHVARGGYALPGSFATNGFESFGNAVRRRVSVLALAHGLVDGFDDVRRSLKVEVERVADVERENFVALPNDFICDASQVTNGVTHVIQAPGGVDFVDLSRGHGKARLRK
jgi:hypothetical protein